MATPVDIIEPLGRVFFAAESSFASGGTDVNGFPVAESLTHERTQKLIEVKTLKVRPHDTRDRVPSFKSGTAQFSYLLQPHSTVLAHGATVPTGASEPPLWVLMRVLFGGQSVFAGTAVSGAGTDANSFSVTSGEGSRLPAGQLFLLNDATDGLVAARSIKRATNAIDCYPDLPNTPAGGEGIIPAVTWYVTRTNSNSLRLRVANAQDSNYQFEYTGGTGTVELKFARGELAVADFDWTFAKGIGPEPLSLSTSSVTDSMDAPLVCRNAIVYLQPVGTTTRVEYPVEAFSLKINLGNKHLETLSGGTEGVRAVARTEGLQDAAVTMELTFRADRDVDTWFDDGEHIGAFIVIPVDTETGRRTIIVDLPRGAFTDRPKHVKGAGNMVKTTIMLEGQLDQSCTGTLDNAELAESAIRIGIA